MRKSFSTIVSTLLVTSLMLTGCGKKSNETDKEVTPEVTTEVTEQATPEASKDTTTDANRKCDIVIVGAGGAGMTSAIQAVNDGATNVVIIEKSTMAGGNTTRSTGGLNASETKYQEAEGIKDSNQLFFDDTMAGGKNLNNEELVWTLVNNSAAAVDFVNEIGGDLSVVGMFGGASVKRIHRPSDTSAVGPMLVSALTSKLEELKVPILYETKAEAIQVDESGKVVGVRVSDANGESVIDCTAVILATGGFGANTEMVTEYNKDLAGFGTTNVAGATGDGIKMAVSIGADIVDMEQIQTHPTVDPNTQTMYTEGVRGNGAILVNMEGNRFVGELGTRDVVSAAILEQTNKQAWMVFDETVRESLSAIESYISKGLVKEGATVAELAQATGMDAANLEKTIADYAVIAKEGNDTFGRTSFESDLSKPNYYAVLVAPAVHHTMGGVKINPSCEVLTKDGNAIPGLYAAGEVTGGVHGANRLGGNAVSDIVVFGRIAGDSAYEYLQANGGNTQATITVETNEEVLTPEVDGNYVDGTYTGTGKGNNGDVTVEVKVEGGNITTITLTDHKETPGIYEGAEKGVIPEIIRTQSADVDVVSGATNTSNGIMEAVKAALKDATK